MLFYDTCSSRSHTVLMLLYTLSFSAETDDDETSINVTSIIILQKKAMIVFVRCVGNFCASNCCKICDTNWNWWLRSHFIIRTHQRTVLLSFLFFGDFQLFTVSDFDVLFYYVIEYRNWDWSENRIETRDRIKVEK